jgi:hypothetical protein
MGLLAAPARSPHCRQCGQFLNGGATCTRCRADQRNAQGPLSPALPAHAPARTEDTADVDPITALHAHLRNTTSTAAQPGTGTTVDQQHDRTEEVLTTLRARTVGSNDDTLDPVLLTPGEINLPAVNHLAIARVLMDTLDDIDIDQLPVIEVPTSSLRLADDQLRADALEWYLARPDNGEHFDDQVSFYGAAGPLAVRRGEEYWLVDGNHRAARAIITGAPTFQLQAFELPD